MSLQVALVKGRSPLSLAIRWQTRGEYSHAALVTSAGTVIDAWPGGVREHNDLSMGFGKGTRIDFFRVEGLDRDSAFSAEMYARRELGCPYDYAGVLKFVSRRRGAHDEKWFCSELVFATMLHVGKPLLERVEAWQVSPTMLVWSPLLTPAGSIVVGKENAHE